MCNERIGEVLRGAARCGVVAGAGRTGARKECVVFASGETNAFKRRGTQWRRDEIRFAGGEGRSGRGALIDSRRATAGRLRRIGDSSGPIKLPPVEESCNGTHAGETHAVAARRDRGPGCDNE